jgi:hypothetical protein
VGGAGLSAWRDGIRRVNAAPAIVAALWALTLAVTLPMSAAMRSLLARHLGDSLAAETAASGVNYDWMQEFADQAAGLGVTFKPTIIGFGAVADNLSAFLDRSERPVVIVAAASVYILLWIFAAGGIIDRYARDRPTHASGFFAASGVFFFRFLRLGVLQAIVYSTLFSSVHPLLFERLYPKLIHDLTVERTAFLLRVALYLVFGALVALCVTVFDYAKVRAIVEDRRSMIGAAVEGIRFVRRNAADTTALFLLNFGSFVAVVALYAALVPAVAGTGVSMWLMVMMGQLYLLARLWVKLVFWASETALFQSRLAHVGYVSRPEPRWPESPQAEQI